MPEHSEERRKPRHECEAWQMQEHPEGGRFCAVCGQREQVEEFVTTEMVQEEGDQDRRFYGIDGTMGDAQDVPHPYVESIYGEWCSLCGLNRSHRAHKRWVEQASQSGSQASGIEGGEG